nr:TetR/AcrR family transcriptional regulator [uncultured Desulfuromonas sp.]
MKCKKDQIIEAAVDLFSEQGFAETSTAEIASRSNVAQGTLFYHFKSKEGILLEVMRQLLEETTANYHTIDQSCNTGIQCIETLLRNDLAIVKKHNKEVKTLIRDMSRKVHESGDPCYDLIHDFVSYKISLLCKFLRQGIEDGSIRDVPVEETAWFLDAAFYGIMHIRLLKNFPLPPLDDNAIQLCLAALSPLSTAQTS